MIMLMGYIYCICMENLVAWKMVYILWKIFQNLQHLPTISNYNNIPIKLILSSDIF